MNLSELSNLVNVIDHLKNIINTAGMSRFTNSTLSTLKNRLKEFEELFITEMLDFDTNNQATGKIINNAIQEARQKMGLVPNNSLEKLQELAKSESIQEKKPFQRRNAKPVVSEKNTEDTNQVDKELSVVDTKTESVKASESKKEVLSPKVNKPYLEDESLAAMLAAEKQKVAAKKRKSS